MDMEVWKDNAEIGYTFTEHDEDGIMWYIFIHCLNGFEEEAYEFTTEEDWEKFLKDNEMELK